jgi:hypothetical protein
VKKRVVAIAIMAIAMFSSPAAADACEAQAMWPICTTVLGHWVCVPPG